MEAAYFTISTVAALSAVMLSNETSRYAVSAPTRLAAGLLLILSALYVTLPHDVTRTWHSIFQSAVFMALLAGGGLQVYSGLLVGAAQVWGEGVLNVFQSPWFKAAAPSAGAVFILGQALSSPHGWARHGDANLVIFILFVACSLLSWREAVRLRRGRLAR